MKRIFYLLLLILALTTTAQAQSRRDSAEKLRVEIRNLYAERLITDREAMRLAYPLKAIWEADADRGGVLTKKLTRVRVRNRRARLRLAPLLAELRGWVRSAGRSNKNCLPMSLRMVCGTMRPCP